MRLRNAEYVLLKNIWAYLESCGRDDLSADLHALIERYEQKQKETREANRKRAAENRKNGYSWPSTKRPEHSKYYGKED